MQLWYIETFPLLQIGFTEVSNMGIEGGVPKCANCKQGETSIKLVAVAETS